MKIPGLCPLVVKLATPALSSLLTLNPVSGGLPSSMNALLTLLLSSGDQTVIISDLTICVVLYTGCVIFIKHYINIVWYVFDDDLYLYKSLINTFYLRINEIQLSNSLSSSPCNLFSFVFLTILNKFEFFILIACFLDSICVEATPKTIMRVMGVKGLTLYHLKSHLQV